MTGNRLSLASLDHTRVLARCVARLCQAGDVLLLDGELGAGKTAFTRLLCEELGIDGRIVASPSFSIMHEYPGQPLGVLHADLYRLGPGTDPDVIGLSDYLDSQWIVVVEWGRYLDWMGPALLMEFFHENGGRACAIAARGEEKEEMARAMKSCYYQEVA